MFEVPVFDVPVFDVPVSDVPVFDVLISAFSSSEQLSTTTNIHKRTIPERNAFILFT